MVWRPEDPEGSEAQKIKYLIVPYTRGHVLDVGCGPRKAFPHFIGIDSCKDTELFGIEIKPDLRVPDASNLQEHIQDESCDAVFSSHLLEHIEDFRAALASWWKCIKVGGHLVLYLPHRNLYPNIGEPGSNPDHRHDFVPEDILHAMVDMHFDVPVLEVRDQGMEYSFLLVLKKLAEPFEGTFSYLRPKPAKTACVCRYGGFGDMIQASNILPELKRRGYHVTVMTTPKGQDILKHDPHVDDWFIQDSDQVPNHELIDFWAAVAPRFDKFINLSESVEGTLLAMPGRANHLWPDAVRRVELNRNYLEWTSQLAELPYKSEARFYSSPEEDAWARQYLADLRLRAFGRKPRPLENVPARFNIMWALAGSSIHKFYPHQDVVIARILQELPHAALIFSGDAACTMLEAGWENEPRIRCESGELSIRQTLTLAKHVQCVIGPETGVLNAVAFEPDVAKVIMLSHSSKRNLSMHWLNTATMQPANTDCYPCHRLHYDRTYCREHLESGAAACQADIGPDRVFNAIARQYTAWLEARTQKVAA